MHQRELHSTACSRNGTASCDGAGGGRYSSKLVGRLTVLESVAMEIWSVNSLITGRALNCWARRTTVKKNLAKVSSGRSNKVTVSSI